MTSNFSKTALVTIVVAIAIASITVVGGVAAQNDTATPEENQTETEYLIEIDQDTRIVHQTWEDGRVEFVIESDRSQRVILTDASIDIQQHEAVDIPRSSHRIPEGRTRLSFTVTNPGDAAITVGTRQTLTGLSPGTGSRALIGGPWGPSDARAAGLGSAISVSIVALFFVIRRIRGKNQKPERVA